MTTLLNAQDATNFQAFNNRDVLELTELLRGLELEAPLGLHPNIRMIPLKQRDNNSLTDHLSISPLVPYRSQPKYILMITANPLQISDPLLNNAASLAGSICKDSTASVSTLRCALLCPQLPAPLFHDLWAVPMITNIRTRACPLRCLA